jgi:mercuric ion transport protein
MSSAPSQQGGLGIVGLGAAACIACCAGPVLAVLGGVSLAGLASTVFLGAGGLLVAAVGAIGYALARRRRGAACALPAATSTPVLLAVPRRRPVPEEDA